MNAGYYWLDFTKPLPLLKYHNPVYGLSCFDGAVKVIESWERHFAFKKIETRRLKRSKGIILQIRVPIC